jgi:hypothetical protein
MIKFEQKGVTLQYEATSKEEAIKIFKYSCDCCCTKGVKLECDRCAIANVHGLVVAYFDDKNKTVDNK